MFDCAVLFNPWTATQLSTGAARIEWQEIEMSNGIHHDGQFVICGGSVQYWIGTNAKTLTGAKAIASKTYQAAVGGKIEVAVFHAAQECYEVVAVKYGHDAWQNA